MQPRPRRKPTRAVGLLALTACAAIAFALLHHSRTLAPRASQGAKIAPAASHQEEKRVPTSLDRSNLRAEFVGSPVCAPCHAEQAAAYAKSHHAQALVPATRASVGIPSNAASFSTALGGTTRFAWQGDALAVTTPGPDGKPMTFSIESVAGVAPLKQYVVATERGKLQALGVAWDKRTREEGGARLLHVYGPRGIAPSDEIFFTRPAQNWNHGCADCHSTFVERGYDPTADAFATRQSELSVGCEACHGPGAEHVRAAQGGALHGTYASGLSVRLTASAPWAPSTSGSPAPRAPDTTEIEVCAPCHSLRQPLREGFIAGDAFLDAFEPELLRPGRYHADGQVEGEVYEWGSFLQSRMYASGVRCSDCHEPHAGSLRAEGNALCARCHEPARFDNAAHSHHAADAAPRCVDCHMPPKTFMEIDVRRDHSIRIPRPDLSVELGTPNACTGCHGRMSSRAAASTLASWFPGGARRAHFAGAFAADRRSAPGALRLLEQLALDPTLPSIARASALERLGTSPRKQARAALYAALASPDALVVYGAVLGIAELPQSDRTPALFSALTHPRRAVRVAAGRALAAVPPAGLDPDVRAALERAFGEVEQSFALGASRSETLIGQSAFERARGNVAAAEASLKRALALAPCSLEAHLSLADLWRARGDEAAAEREIRAALACDPESAFAHHALGLWLARRGEKAAARASLARAFALAPAEARFGYVLAVASAELGDVASAVEVLTRATARRPNDATLLQALEQYLRALGQEQRAAEMRARIERLLSE